MLTDYHGVQPCCFSHGLSLPRWWLLLPTLLDGISGCYLLPLVGMPRGIVLMLAEAVILLSCDSALWSTETTPFSSYALGLSPGRPKNCFCSPKSCLTESLIKIILSVSPCTSTFDQRSGSLSPGAGRRTNTRTFSISPPTSYFCHWSWGMKLPLFLYLKSTSIHSQKLTPLQGIILVF